MSLPRILIVAGSDSSGGAGIQADIKTISILGGYAMTAITAITAQNSCGVRGVHPVPPEMVRSQIEACMEDIGADAIKIGMLFDAAIINAVADAIETIAQHIPVILDPVMVATSGDRLLEPDAIHSLIDRLIPLADLVTPNIPEVALLSGHDILTRNDYPAAVQRIQQMGAQSVLLKGGHSSDAQLYDLLLTGDTMEWFESPRIETRHTHGTGCTLASAIATYRGQGMALSDAVIRSRDYLHQAIRTAPEFGQGHGPVNHLHPLMKLQRQ